MSTTNTTKELRIAVGSKNPAKIRAVEQALGRILAHKALAATIKIQSTGYDVESGVRDQPMGDQETCLGAKNRAAAAYAAYRAQYGRPPHLAFGLEGGLEEVSLLHENGQNGTKDLYCMAWMAVYGKRSAFTVDALAAKEVSSYHGDRGPRFGCGKSGSFPIAPAVMKLVESGLELGPANDQVFCSKESRSGLGAVGLITDGLVDRSAYYEHALLLALAPWFRPDVYP